MRRVYVPLTEPSIKALVALAARRGRSPQRQAALIIERYLERVGYLDDPTQRGQALGHTKDAGSAERLAGGGAASL